MVVIIFCKYLSIINNHIKGSGICPRLEFFADDLPLVYVRHLFFANDLQMGVARPSPICSLPTTQCRSPRQTARIVQQLERCLILFVACQVKKLAKINPVYSFLLMCLLMQEQRCVRHWDFGLLPLLALPQDFGYIVERVQGRLAGWKVNLLSFARRLILTQVVTTTIPNYAMQCVALPTKILNSVDRLSHNFLWGSTESKKKIHLVNWKKIAKPKCDGGLGIQAAKAKNIANLAKLNWRLQCELIGTKYQ